MFFKKIFILSLILGGVFYTHAEDEFDMLDTACLRDIKKYYPDLITGHLTAWRKQQRFFNCLSDMFQFWKEKDFFWHDPSRDYYTKIEVRRIFEYFKYHPKAAEDLTNKFLTLKTILIGGDIDKLKDEEFQNFYKLISNNQDDPTSNCPDKPTSDYQDIYSSVHKVIPIFRKAFHQGGKNMTPQDMELAKAKIWEGLLLLSNAYKCKNLTYPIDHLQEYAAYLANANLIPQHITEQVTQGFRFIHHIFEGIFPGQKKIRGNDWDDAIEILYRIADLFLFYKAYFPDSLAPAGIVVRLIDGLQRLTQILQIRETVNRGFPINNLDEILGSLLSFVPQNSDDSDSQTSFFAESIHPHALPLFTRTLNCFSLNKSSKRNCKSKWGPGGSEPVVTLSFSDSKFEIFSNQIKRHRTFHDTLMMSPENIQFIQTWFEQYKQDILRIHKGYATRAAKERQFDHWLNDRLFGWDETHSKLTFAPIHPLESKNKAYQLLHYQVFLPLLFHSYLPARFFASDPENSPSISFETWQDIIREMSPALITLKGYTGYQPSWRDSFTDLFHFSDSFLHSSNRDQHLNSRELIDASAHLLEGSKNSHLAYNKISRKCHNSKVPCIVNTLLFNPDILSAYPKLKAHINMPHHTDKYREQITSILEYKEEDFQQLSLLSFFMILQIIELNRELMDKDQSYYIASNKELLPFVKRYEEEVSMRIPYLSGHLKQARAFLMYSFKTRQIPFFTKRSFSVNKNQPFLPIQFTTWYLHNGHSADFYISPVDFHLVMLNFYDIYTRN